MDSFFEFNVLFPALPEAFLACASMALLLLGAFRGPQSVLNQMRFSIIILAITFILVAITGTHPDPILDRHFISNDYTDFAKYIVLIGGILTQILSLGYYRNSRDKAVIEFPVLILLASLGMMVMISSYNLLILYMGLELQSLSLYVLASIHRSDMKSSEAGLKYFVLGALSSGLLLFGISFIYGFTGTIYYNEFTLTTLPDSAHPIMAYLGVILVLIGVFFKVSAVPFHMWTPDVYEGSPTVVTAFFAICPKAAALSVLAFLLIKPFGGNFFLDIRDIVSIVAILTMIIGALGAIAQSNIKRLIAYSSIGHVGYILTGLASGSQEGIYGMLMYLAIYAVMSIGLFACIMMIRLRGEITYNIANYAGLSRNHPYLTLAITVLLLSMTGIPPFAGFFGKFYVFHAAVKAELYTLAVIGVLSSVIAAYYYLRIIKLMYFDRPHSALSTESYSEVRVLSYGSALANTFFFPFLSPLIVVTTQAAEVLF